VWESNINVVVDDEPDHCNPINGGWPARTAMCRIYPEKTYGGDAPAPAAESLA
jgi:hypothetical protein